MNSISLEEILDKYPLPQRFLAYFASQVAKDALSKIKNPDPRSLAAVDMAEAYGNGEDFTEEHKRQIIDDAAAAAAHATNYSATDAGAARTAAYAADAANASTTIPAAEYAQYATCAADDAAHRIDRDYYKPLLLSLIESRLTKLEKILIFGELK